MKRKGYVNIVLLTMALFCTVEVVAQELVPFRHKGLYGLVNEKLEVVLKAEYKSAEFTNDSEFILLRRQQDDGMSTSVANNKAEIVWAAERGAYVTPIFGGKFFVNRDQTGNGDRFCVVDVASGSETGTSEIYEIFGVRYTDLEPKPAYAARLKGNKHLYLTDNLKKSYLEEKEYHALLPMIGGVAVAVTKDLKKQIINRRGKILLDNILESSSYFCEGLMPVILSDGRSGFANTKGKLEIECPIEPAVYGFSPRGLPVLDCVFSGGVAYVPVSGTEWRIYRRDGSVAASGLGNPPAGSGVFREGMLVVSEKGADGSEVYGYMDTEGRLALPCVFTEATEFRGGYAIVEHAGKEALVDKAGRLYYSDDIVAGDRTSRGSVE